MAEVEVQRVLATINQVFVFQIPPQTSAAGHRADSWPSTPAWSGRLQVSSVGEDAVIELKDPTTGALFAACPIKAGGPPAIQKVVDSSRYFVLRAVDRTSGRHAFIGIAFNNRSDAFDFNVAIDDFNKELRREKTQEQSVAAAPPVDYSLKEGQTIRIKLNTRKNKDADKEDGDEGSDPFGSSSSPKKTVTNSGEADLLGFSSSTLEMKRPNVASKASKASKRSENQSYKLSISRRSVGRAPSSNHLLHTRVAKVLEEDVQDAFDPNATAIKIWQHTLLLCLLQEAFLLPYFLAFQPQAVGSISLFYVIVIACEAVFVVDFYVQAHTGFYSDGNLIRERRLTRRRYMRSVQFSLDVFAILPYQVLVVKYSDVLAKLLFLKLLRWSRLPHFVSSLDEFYAKHFIVLKLFKVAASTVYLAHVLACVRYSFGYDETHSNQWLPSVNDKGNKLHTKYLSSLFWSVGIMTGLLEGELPHHSSEFLFTTLVALCGFSMFTTLVATIFVISKCESGQTEAMEARINQLVHILCFHRVPESQQTRAVEYLKRYYTDAESNDREVAKTLCPSIANDIQVELLRSTVGQIALFNGCSEQFIVAITSLLEMIALPAHTTLFSTGDHGDAMYVVHSGVLSIIVKSVTVREIRKGACFGELSVFSTIPRTASVVTATYAILYKLTRFHCERILDGYPDCEAVIAGHVENVLDHLKSVQAHDDTDPSTSTTATQSGNLKALKAAEHRRVSLAAGCVAGASDLANSLAKMSSTRSSRKTSLMVRLVKKGTVVPVRHGMSLVRDRSGRHSSVPDTSTDTEFPASIRASSAHQHSTLHGDFRAQRRILGVNATVLWHLLPLQKPIDHQSLARKWWLLLLLGNLSYCWFMVPMQIIFPLWQQPSWLARTTDSISNAGLIIDMLLNFSLSFMVNSEKILNPTRSARRYVRRGFTFDLLCAIPYEYFHPAKYGIMRAPRLLRVLLLKGHLDEIDYFIHLTNRQQLMLLGMFLFMMFHVVTCIHFAISRLEGFNRHDQEAWISSIKLCLRRINATHFDNCNGIVFNDDTDQQELRAITAMEYSRSLYYAVGVLASPGKSVEPESDVQLLAALILMLSGFFITAIVVDNVQKRFTASAFEQKEFFATTTRIQLFLRRQNAPLAIHHRVKSFLDYWWSSHRGAVIGELLADLPRPIRLDVLRSICTPVLQTLALLQGARSVWSKLEEVMVENAEFMLYGQGEIVYRHGDYVTGIFFLLEGELSMVKMGGEPREIPPGGFFGTAALTQQERGDGYTEHVSASSGCILLFVSRAQVVAMEAIFPALKTELLCLERRLQSSKIAKMHMHTCRTIHKESKIASNAIHSVFLAIQDSFSGVYDPDSVLVLAWETWVFLVMTAQWILVMLLACFALQEQQHKFADSLLVFLELSFFLDMHIRARLGFYEYGNKVMNTHRIRDAYFRSGTFALDIAAILPFYIVNWCVPQYEHWDLINVNKLLRLFKVPNQLHALETRYLKRATELRLLKLLYYTFLLSHVLGCIWFNFASKVAMPNYSSSLLSESKQTAFGENLWLPQQHLEHGSHILQYMASLYWSFGLMSASSEPEFPETTAQCIFSVITMTTGFFLFAYVIGNFTDIIELKSSDTREFNAKMGAVREMLDHFHIPEVLRERVQTFLLFKRYHTITQEHILVNCLPPSLLTDIRLVHLRPMIEKVEFLRGMEGSITRMLVSQFTQVLVSRGEFVCKYGESGSDMFFIFTGVMSVLLPTRVASRAKAALRSTVDDLVGKKSSKSIGSSRIGPDPSGYGQFVGEQLKKVNEISAGSYFGENSLFTKAQRNAYIQSQTSCILYRLSRESLERVFDRYPEWKHKVLRIASIHREQTRLMQLSREEQRRRTTSNGMALSRADIMNERAERLKEKKAYERANGVLIPRLVKIGVDGVNWVNQTIVKRPAELVDKLLHGTTAQSTMHLFWLRFIICCTMFMAITVPYQLALDSMEQTTFFSLVVKAVGLLCEVAFIVDVRFSFNVQGSQDAMELYDQDLHTVYRNERLLWDIIAAIPFHGFLAVFNCSPWLKLLRCVKILNVMSYVDEINRRGEAYELTRFWYICLLYLLVIYWAACAYLAVSMEVGFGTQWEAWLPSQELQVQDPSSAQLTLRFLRGLFFATTTFVKKARNIAPELASLYAFNIALSFIGLITMSFVIGELASLFISFIGLEVDFRKKHIAVELYLARLRASDRIKARAYSFMTSLWSSHAGVNYDNLLSEMPSVIRSACIMHASKKPLDWFVMKVVSPVCWEGEVRMEEFTISLAERLHFEEYPRNENVVTEGSIVRAMYFVVKGHLKMQSRLLLVHPVGLKDGSYFGERGLLGCTISAYTVRSVRACDLLSLSSEDFSQVLHKFPFTRLALTLCSQAYSHLKKQKCPYCSTSELEERWGAALLHVVCDFRDRHFSELDARRHKAIQIVAAGETKYGPVFLPDGDVITSGEYHYTKESITDVHADSFNVDELPRNLKDMLLALQTPSDCFEAFGPLLHILLATDPLDWSASFKEATESGRRTSRATQGTLRTRSIEKVAEEETKEAEDPIEEERPEQEEAALVGPAVGDIPAAAGL